MNNQLITFTLAIYILLGLIACADDIVESPVSFDATPYVFSYGNLPTPDIPSDNKLTEQGVKLGRMLFYEKLLSKDNSQSCASCHQ